LIFPPRQQISFGLKRAEQCWPGAAAGALAILSEAWGMSERSSGKIKQPVVLPDLQGEGHERKEASLLKAFWLLCGYKVKALPRPRAGMRHASPFYIVERMDKIASSSSLQ
jgi:hypothetical protein